jgi:hypothetical protein
MRQLNVNFDPTISSSEVSNHGRISVPFRGRGNPSAIWVSLKRQPRNQLIGPHHYIALYQFFRVSFGLGRTVSEISNGEDVS